MYFLTNEERTCFGLILVKDNWILRRIKNSRYDDFESYVYIEDNIIKKLILTGLTRYEEYEYNELLSDDKEMLLPKTSRGKALKLTNDNLIKRKQFGMSLTYNEKYITLYNSDTEIDYYYNCYENLKPNNIDDFSNWVKEWCEETSISDINEINDFIKEKRRHVKYQEGDVFRFKITRRQYGYGRILLDYNQMRKNKEPFWDILMGTPLVCSVYHIITEDKNITIDKLKTLKSLPSSIMNDNKLFYGEYEIIGNIPLSDYEDYPIMYGSSIAVREKAVYFQRGKLCRRIDNVDQLYIDFTNNAVGFILHLREDVLKKCIEEKSNKPYWDLYSPYFTNRDLRNPKFKKELKKICKQMKVKIGKDK